MKYLSITISLVLIVFCFFGCSNGRNQENESSTTESTPEESTIETTQTTEDTTTETSTVPEETHKLASQIPENETTFKLSDYQEHIDYFVTIPWKSLGYNDIYPGVKIPFNLCRMRLDPGLEKSSYGPCRTLYGFRDVEKYGIICIGREVTGMGRYEEF